MNERIKQMIDDKGLKHRFVADKAGMPYKTLSATLNGRRKIRVEELVKIGQVLGVSLDELTKEGGA